MKSCRREGSKVNARVPEIFAGLRNAWQQEEWRLLARIDVAEAEIAGLRARVEEMERTEAERLQREVDTPPSPLASVSHLASLQSRNRMKSRWREDSKANARVAEIFAGQHNAWQQEERRLLARIDVAEADQDGRGVFDPLQR